MIRATAMAGTPTGARAWRIRYETTNLNGRRTEATGVLVAPDGPAPAGGRDVVAWAHGTVGIAANCTPIRTLDQIPGLNDMIARGWAAVASDYPGLGTPGPHAYLVGDAAARVVLDSVRAAHGFGDARVGRRFVAWGHSQGGHAVLFAGQQARSYAPELTLIAVAALITAPPFFRIRDATSRQAAPPRSLSDGVKRVDGIRFRICRKHMSGAWTQ